MLNPLRQFFSTKYMVKPEMVQGRIPSAGEAYRCNYDMAWPSAMEFTLIALVSSINMAMVGGIGPQAISAVGITSQPRLVILSALSSINISVSVMVARRKGERNQDAANLCLQQALYLSFIVSSILNAAGFIWAKPILLFAGAQADVIDAAVIYFKFIVVGLFFSSFGMTITAAQRGAGHTRISLQTNLTANIVIVILNFFLIQGRFGFPALGVMGAGISTLIGNILSLAMAMYSVSNKEGYLFLFSRQKWKFDKDVLKNLINITYPAAGEQMFLRIGYFTYAKMVASLGTIIFATHQICMSVTNLSYEFGMGLSAASASLVGQNLGSKRPDLAVLYGKVGQRFALIVSSLFFVLFLVFDESLIGIFTEDPDVIALGVSIMPIVAVNNLVQTSQTLYNGCLRGAGDVRFTALFSLVSTTFFRPIFSWLLCYPIGLGLAGAWIGLFLDQSLRLIIFYLRFSGEKWTKINI